MVDLALSQDTFDTKSAEGLRRTYRADKTFRYLTLACALLLLTMFAGIILALVAGAWPAIREFGFSFLWTQAWNPVTERFGALAPIYGTLVTSIIAMLISVPVGIGIAIFLTELCPRSLDRKSTRLNSSHT